MWSAALGKPVKMQEEVITDAFTKLSNGKNFFTEDDYILQLEDDPNFMTWFTKPSSDIQKQIGKQEEDVNCVTQQQHNDLIDKFISFVN